MRARRDQYPLGAPQEWPGPAPAGMVRHHARQARHVGVLQPDAMSDLVSQGLQEVHAPVRVQGPVLRVVHMDVANLRIVSVGQSPTRTVERISVKMVVSEEINRNIHHHIPARFLIKEEVGDVTPVSKGFLDGCNNFIPGKLGALSIISPTELIFRVPLTVNLGNKDILYRL